MPLTTEYRPYEFLARWDEQGVLQGCHAIFNEVKSFEDQVLSIQQGQALTPDQAVALNFPFADVLTALQADAIAQRDEALTECETMRRAHAAELEAKDANMQTILEQAAAREQEAQQAIADLQAALTASEQALQAKTSEAATLQRENEGLTLDLEALRASIQGEPAPEEPAA